MLCFAISKLILFDEKFEIPPFFAHFNKIFLKFLSLPCSITRPFHQGTFPKGFSRFCRLFFNKLKPFYKFVYRTHQRNSGCTFKNLDKFTMENNTSQVHHLFFPHLYFYIHLLIRLFPHKLFQTHCLCLSNQILPGWLFAELCNFSSVPGDWSTLLSTSVWLSIPFSFFFISSQLAKTSSAVSALSVPKHEYASVPSSCRYVITSFMSNSLSSLLSGHGKQSAAKGHPILRKVFFYRLNLLPQEPHTSPR